VGHTRYCGYTVFGENFGISNISLHNYICPRGDEPIMRLTSQCFVDQGDIPKKYTCDSKNISPELAWSDVPEGAKSFVLIVDDPDAPDPANL